jgi:LysR family glycine cleavage system transcriptional activator
MSSELPPLNAVRAFHAVGRTLSVSRAAAELHVTPGAVSRQLRILEDRIGRPLFVRDGPRINLTEEGRRYWQAVDQGLALIRHASVALRRNTRRTRLTVSTIPSFATRWLAPRLGAFREAFPGVHLRIHSTTRVVDFRAEGDVDFAIRYGRGGWRDVATAFLFGETVTPVCAPSLLENRAPLKAPDELVDWPLLHDEHHESWSWWFEKQGVPPPPVDLAMTFIDASSLLEAAAAGAGVALARSRLVERDLGEGRLVELPFPHVESGFGYYLVTDPDRGAERQFEEFTAWLREVA